MNNITHTVFLALHVVAATFIMGASLATLLVLLQEKLSLSQVRLLRNLWKIAGPAMGFQLITGGYLAITDWATVGSSPLFWANFVLFIFAAVLGGVVMKKKLNSAIESGKDPVKLDGSKNWAIAEFTAILAIVIIGVILTEIVLRGN